MSPTTLFLLAAHRVHPLAGLAVLSLVYPGWGGWVVPGWAGRVLYRVPTQDPHMTIFSHFQDPGPYPRPNEGFLVYLMRFLRLGLDMTSD